MVTFQELIDQVPVEDRGLPVEIDVMCGNFPSGEEGAEDWIMSARFVGIHVRTCPAWGSHPEHRFIEIEVAYE